METSQARWFQMRDLFDRATELPTGQRTSFIEGSGVDTGLRQELISLLEADQCQKKKPITGAIGASLEKAAEARRQKLVGSIVGEYQLLKVLGYGGAGTVYLAEKLDAEDHSKVAIKIVEGAAINGDTRRRFRDERQILANLNHSNIARLFDAGDTEDGYPYLVMDYIEGEPIDRYCDRHRLNVRQRIELFLQVCSAVQYAHQHLVIHRDLKPENILVTPNGTPKLLDFGIAKLLVERNEDQGFAVTKFHEQLLTPAYASPEQILGKNISTTSDVYMLGVALYELLTGVRPFANIKANSHLEYERIVLTQEPEKPSNSLQALHAAASSDPAALLRFQRIVASRNAPLRRLYTLLKGDLDAILLRSLRSRPEDRYESVEQLADDLRHHLAHQPINAVKHHWMYVIRRFIVRNALMASLSTLFITLLITALGVITWQSHHFATERDQATRAKQNSDDAINFMVNIFGTSNSNADANKPMTARDLLDQAANKVHENFQQTSDIKARLLEAIGRGRLLLGFSNKGVPLIEEAVAMQRQLATTNTLPLAHALLVLGRGKLFSHEAPGAKAALVEARSILEKAGQQESADYANTLVCLGIAELQRGDPDAARKYIENALPLLERIYGPMHPEVASALTSLGIVFQWQEKYDLFEKASHRAVEIYQASTPENHPDRLLAESQWADHLLTKGRINDAELILEKSLSARKQIFGERNFRATDQTIALVQMRQTQGYLKEAEELAVQAVSIDIENLGEHNHETAYSRVTLAGVLWRRGKYAQAEHQLRIALFDYRAALPEDHLYISSAEYFLSETLLSQNRLAEATDEATITIQSLQRANASNWRIARAKNVLGAALFAQQKYDTAQPLLEQSYEILLASIGPDLDTVQLAHDRLKRFYSARHQYDKLAALRTANLAARTH